MFTRCLMHIMVLFIGFAGLCGFGGRGNQSQAASLAFQDTTVQRDSLETERPKVLREKVIYQSGGRRDPFRSLFEDKKEQEEELPLFEIEESTLVGIMRGPGGGLALVRDAEGRTYVLREGSKIRHGYLRRVKSDAAIFSVAKYGRYRSVELELKSEKRADSFKQSVLETTPRPKPKPKTTVTTQISQPSQPEGILPVPSNGKYTLQIAAFRKEHDAQRLQQWLRERGYETRIEAVTIPESGLWYRVRYGMYDTYESVKTMAETMRQRFDFYCWIVPLDS